MGRRFSLTLLPPYFLIWIVAVAWFPDVSLAVALTVCVPLAAFLLFHLYDTVAPFVVATTALSTESVMPATATLSVAFAPIVTIPATVAPFAGLVIVTTGGVVSVTTPTTSESV